MAERFSTPRAGRPLPPVLLFRSSVFLLIRLFVLQIPVTFVTLQSTRHAWRKVTNSMELSPSSETDSCAATQELLRVLRNPNIHYHVHKNPQLVVILSQINPVHTTTFYFPKAILILSTHVHIDLPNGLFPSGFPTEIYTRSSSFNSRYISCPSHPPWLHHYNYTWWRVQVMKLFIMQVKRKV
jgi:hypothetical protein